MTTATQKTQQATENKTDIYARITDKIIADLEKGELFWRKPWSSDHLAGHITRPLRANDTPYTGINILVLWATAAEKGYATPHWMTFNQAVQMKASVRKGEKGAQVVYADKMTKEEQNEKGEAETKQIPFLKQYTVFNASQIEGLPPAYYKVSEIKPANPEQRNERVEQFFAQTKADIRQGVEARYFMNSDFIEMPPFESFFTAKDYYATLGHELTHWTRHPKRLDRDFGKKKWGDEGYAKEELVAEIGACFLAADLGIEPKPAEEHAAYIQSWLEVLKNDKRFIFSAAHHAQKAAEYCWSMQPERQETTTQLPQPVVA